MSLKPKANQKRFAFLFGILYNIVAHAKTYEVADTLTSVVMSSEKSGNSY